MLLSLLEQQGRVSAKSSLQEGQKIARPSHAQFLLFFLCLAHPEEPAHGDTNLALILRQYPALPKGLWQDRTDVRQ